MNKDEIRAGLLAGRILCQEEWSSAAEIRAVDELVSEGAAQAEEWRYSDGFQCARRYVRAALEKSDE